MTQPTDREMAISVLVSMIKDTSQRTSSSGVEELKAFSPDEAGRILINAGIKALVTLGVTEDEIENGVGLLIREGVFR